MTSITLSDANFATEVSQSNQPVLVDFWATWCGPCKLLSPVLDEIAAENAGRFKITKVNIEEGPQLAAKFRVHAVPTLLFIKDGEVRDHQVGALPKAEIVKRLEALA